MGRDKVDGVPEQRFSWGSLRWLPLATGSPAQLSVGIVTIAPRRRQCIHEHSVDEQIIYVLRGCGYYYINGERVELRPGSLVHIPFGAEHLGVNDGNEPLEVLLVSCPAPYRVVGESILSVAQGGSQADLKNSLEGFGLAQLSQIQEVLFRRLGLGVGFFLPSGIPMLQPIGRPDFCHLVKEGICVERGRRLARQMATVRGPGIYRCCRRIYIVCIPLLRGNELSGWVSMGYVRISEPTSAELKGLSSALTAKYHAIPMEPLNRLAAVKSLLAGIADTLVMVGDILLAQQRIHLQDRQLMEAMDVRFRLERALLRAQADALVYQTNPHFLFNTLNAISGLALLEGAAKTNEAIQTLASLLRHTLKSGAKVVPLREEIENVKKYLELQQLRFGKRLVVEVEGGEVGDDILLPAMTLQPLVENSILHGIVPMTRVGRVCVRVVREKRGITITVEDNGVGIPPERLRLLTWEGNADCQSHMDVGGGLDNVRKRLAYYFGEKCTFHISSRPGEGTTVTIRLCSGREEGER